MSVFKRLINELFTWKWLYFFIPSFIFGGVSRQSVVQGSFIIEKEINQWDVMLAQLSDPYFLIYIFLPFMLLFSCLSIRDCWDSSILIRVRSWRRWLQFSIQSFLPYSISALVLMIIVSVILTLGSHYELNWSPYSSETESIHNWVSAVAQQSGFSPYWVILLNIIQLLLAILAIHAVTSLLYLLYPKTAYIYVWSLFIFMYAVISFKFFSFDPKWIVFNYMTFYSSLSMYHSFYPGFIILLGIIALVIFVAPHFKKIRLNLVKHWTKKNYGYLLYIILIFLGLKSTVLFQGNYEVTVWDSLYLRFYGFARNGGVSLPLFLYYIIVFIGFVYFHKIRIADYLSGRFYYTVIRYKSLWDWYSKAAIRIGFFTSIFLIVLMCFTVLLGFLFNLELRPVLTVQGNLSVTQLIYHFVVNGWLQISNYITIIFIVNWVSRDTTYRLGVLIVLIVTILPAINRGAWIPSGLNAMGQLTGSWEDTIRITIVLVSWLTLQMVLIRYLFRKKNMFF